jgi:hypothetical protein
MGNGTIGKGPSASNSPSPISTPAATDQKNADVSSPPKTDPSDQQVKPASKQTGKIPQALAHDPSIALRKAKLQKSLSNLKTPSKAHLNEMNKAMQDGKKEEAIRLVTKYYGIDTSSAAEVRYKAPKQGEAPEQGTSKAPGFEKIDTATKIENGKIVIDIGDESFQFKGKNSPEWLASAIYHESFHAKNHFNPNEKPTMQKDTSPERPGKSRMSQEEIFQEIEAYARELSAAGKLGLSSEQVQELQHRQGQLKGMLTPDNMNIVNLMLQGRKDWPHMY